MPPKDAEPTFTESARRAQIIRSAIATVNEIGYARASLSEIASRAQVAKSAIVYYFGSKDALLLQVADHVFTALGTDVWEAVSQEPTPDGQLRAYARAHLGHVDQHRHDVAAAVAIVVSHRTTDGSPLYLATSDEDTAVLRDILTRGMEAGVFRQLPVTAASTIVESMLDIAITAVQRDPAADITEMKDEIIAFVIRGLT